MQNNRHYFPGGNTPVGFVSYYDEILNKDSIGRLAVIKGGPGTGKSTFMKTLAARLNEAGETVDYLHCSSDSHSLDGIFLPRYNSALIDGTAPHIVDARYPGAADTVLNFCEFINHHEMALSLPEISKTAKSISDSFQEAYRYLSGAAGILNLMEQRSRKQLVQAEVDRFAAEFTKRLNSCVPTFRTKTMFLSAITPDGVKNYLTENLSDRFVVMLQTAVGDASGAILSAVADACRRKGIDLEEYCCPMRPNTPEHLVFPSANLALTVANQYHTYKSPDEVIYFSDFCKSDYDNSSDAEHYDALINAALKRIRNAKAMHDRLEQFYIKNVDFSKISALEEKTLAFLTS